MSLDTASRSKFHWQAPALKLIHAHTSLARTGYTFPQQAGFSKPSTVVTKILRFLSMRVDSSLAKRFVHVKGGETSKFERCWAPPSDENSPTKMVRAGLQLFHSMNMNLQPQDFMLSRCHFRRTLSRIDWSSNVSIIICIYTSATYFEQNIFRYI